MTFPIAALDLTPLIAAVLGGGMFGGVVTLLKFPKDRDAVVVSSAQGALIVQSGVIDALQEEIARLKARITELESELERVRRASPMG
jgi:anaerobic glycerol-3-phosphate dehydrogenase